MTRAELTKRAEYMRLRRHSHIKKGLCPICGKPNKSRPGMWACKDCYDRAMSRRKRPEIVQQAKEYHARKYQEQKSFFDKIKRDRGCMYCGEKTPVCLDFHHRDPSTKKFRLSQVKQFTTPGMIAKVAEEIAKCDVICTNCHRKLHYDPSSLPNIG